MAVTFGKSHCPNNINSTKEWGEVNLKRIKEGPSSGYFQVFEDGGFDPDVDAVGSEPAEGYPIDVHLPAMEVSGDADHGLGSLFGGYVKARGKVDFPFLG